MCVCVNARRLYRASDADVSGWYCSITMIWLIDLQGTHRLWRYLNIQDTPLNSMNLILNDAYEVFMLSVFFYVVSFFLI